MYQLNKNIETEEKMLQKMESMRAQGDQITAK